MMKPTDEAHKKNLSATKDGGVQCLIDQVWVHSIPIYLAYAHPDTTLEAYQERFGDDTPLLSEAIKTAQAKKGEMVAHNQTAPITLASHRKNDWSVGPSSKKSFADVFEFGNAPLANNKRGEPIMIECLGECGRDSHAYLPDIDTRYIFNIDLVKAVMMGVALKYPVLLWGMHGTGKTTVFEQYCARTGRPLIRVQHTASTEEAHILGQYVLKNGDTEFEPGPLAVAMRYGLVYLADEYDFAMPNVTAVYQPVLEGKSLLIKEAPPEWRQVHAHPNFRFFATGNTNGGGDETGLYQGTQIQNAANYSRFGITIEVGYMPEKQETAVVSSQAQVHADDAEKLVKIAAMVREAYFKGDIGVTVSPRELIHAATLARSMGGEWRVGLEMAYMNRLSSVDRKAVSDLAQRVLG